MEEYDIEPTDPILQQSDTTDNSTPGATQEAAGVFDLSEVIEEVSEKLEMSSDGVRLVLEAALTTLKVRISTLGHVQLHNFGSFHVQRLAARAGIDPQGESYSVGERVTVEFNPFADFRAVLTEKQGLPAIS